MSWMHPAQFVTLWEHCAFIVTLITNSLPLHNESVALTKCVSLFTDSHFHFYGYLQLLDDSLLGEELHDDGYSKVDNPMITGIRYKKEENYN